MISKSLQSVLPLLYLSLAAVAVHGQNLRCEFDSARLEFVGTPTEQARCLLRPNGIGGVLSAPMRDLPAPLEELIGRKTAVSTAELQSFLEKRSIEPDAVGGDPRKPLVTVPRPDGTEVSALYFVIHDTSHPYLGDADFPSGFDTDAAWRGNDLSVWTKQPVAHVFVNRLGQSLTTTPFDEPVRKGFGTKFARDLLKADRKGLKIHIELVQPRRRDPSDSNPKNDRLAPVPGFSKAQYERLAILYVAASVRRGSWLIPGYHSAYDAGIKDAHDDPQNFDLGAFAAALRGILKEIK